MKKLFLYHVLLIGILSFVGKVDVYAQCTSSVSISLSATNGVIVVNPGFITTYFNSQNLPPPANTAEIVLLIPSGNYVAARFENLDYCKATIRKSEPGEVTFAGYKFGVGPAASTIEILNCHHLELDGHGIKVLDAYGTGVLHGPNQQGVNIALASSNIDVHHLDIQNPSGFAGIMAKDSPGCGASGVTNVASNNPNDPFMHHIYIHHNYIHNVPQGEGIYAGDTGFMTGRDTECGILYPQKMENVEIHHNFIEKIGLDAIQLGSCIAGGRIYDNFCVEYGTLGGSSQSNGIQIGLGNIGTICERNFIRQGAERAENAGNGILCQGVGGNCIQNNIVYNTLENSIYVNERTTYSGGPDAIGHKFITQLILDPLIGVSIVHNTLMYPEKSPDPAINRFGVHVAVTRPNSTVRNNLLFGLFSGTGINASSMSLVNNKTISVGWKTVRDQYLASYGAYSIPNNTPYAAAMEAYFTDPAIHEEDNHFRSPTDFYPVHADIINSVTGSSPNACPAGEDFFGTARSVPQGCANDHGAVELTFPVFTIVEDCGNSQFTIHPADPTGTFSWAFGGVPDTSPSPTFTNPGAGSYPLTFTYSSADGCSEGSGTIDIELTCSCPCEGANAINIDAGQGTSWQDTEIMDHVNFSFLFGNMLSLNNRCLNIKGRLLIDDFISGGSGMPIDLTIVTGFIRMQPGSEIVVQNQGGLWLLSVNAEDGGYGKGVHGCDFMWEGIDVEAGGRITVTKSTVQDANTAIGITGSADIRIQNTSFENNYRGLDIEPLIDPTANDPALFNLTVGSNGLSGNFFGTIGNGLKGTVSGGIPAGTRGNVGIKMAYVNLVYLQGGVVQGTNNFENLHHGIYANQSNLVVRWSRFKKVDYGARLFNTAATFQGNKFNDVALRGIESLDAAMLKASNNGMENVHGRGINYVGATNLTAYQIDNNTIASLDHCINVEAGITQHLKINGNNLTLLQPADNTAYPNRAAIRVFSVGQDALDVPDAEINNQAAITINGHGKGIAVENMNGMDVHHNSATLQNLGGASFASAGIILENAPNNYLYGNSVLAQGDFPHVRNIILAASQNNKLCCNSTDGGGTGLYFFGPSSSENGLNNTTIGNHNIGLLCEAGARIGLQEHRGNTWLPQGSYGTAAAEHRGTDFFINQSTFRVLESPGTPFRPANALISTPNAMGAAWFRESDVGSSTCENNADCLPAPVAIPPGGKESDQKVAEWEYATGDYAAVHNWEAELDLFARLHSNEALRNSESWYQSFYAQAGATATGAYHQQREQAKALLNLSADEHQKADTLRAAMEDNVATLTAVGEASGQATTAADSIALEADWSAQYTKLNGLFAEWRQLSAEVRQRIAAGIPALQAANAALPEDIIPAANEKLMNAMQLQRILGEPFSEQQQEALHALAFSCPLEAGNAVYRARSILRTQGSYTFNDESICGLGKGDEKPDEKKSKIVTAAEGSWADWRIYPNPAQGQVVLEGPSGASLTKIQLFDHLGRVVLTAQGGGDSRQELQLPADLSAGVYFLVLEQADGSRQTHKLIVKP